MQGVQCRASYLAMRGQYSLTNGHSYHLRGLLITLLWILHQVQAGEMSIECCENASGSCKSACEEISLITIVTDPEKFQNGLQALNKYCDKHHMETFWNCMNETLEGINEGSNWIGRPCCYLPQSEGCKMECLKANSLQNLTAKNCRRSHEIVFFECIQRQKDGKICCQNASTSKCSQACKNVFVGNFTPTKEHRNAVNKYCSDKNPGIQQCVQSHFPVTLVDPEVTAKNIHCCDKSIINECITECKKILGAENVESHDITDGLSREKCGPILPQVNEMWGCFLSNSVVNRRRGSVVQSAKVGLDSGKLQCCFRAVRSICKSACIDFFNQRSTWSNFIRVCQYPLAETEMVRCLTEVDEPCELGCEGLNYCTNFNFRPTQLFRNCAPFADYAAQKDIDSWEEKGVIHLPMMEIPILKISQCHSNVWKAIACTLQIKPCHHEAHVNRICKSDCIDILNKCVDRSRLLQNQNPITLCELLSPPGNDTPCISLAPYLDVSKDIPTAREVTHPCKPNECNSSEICMVKRNCLNGQICEQPYMCITGCRMGLVSNLIVPQNSFVRIPSNTHGPHTHGPLCHMVCYCNHDNVLEDCMTQPCFSSDGCWHEETKYDHNTFFKSGCKTCFCYDGEVTCSPKQCWSGLPCNCQDHYVPVCGANGKTYPSSCLARCVGLTDDQYEFGACYDSDPCSPNSCHPYYRCVPKKRVCLSIRHRSCKQYDCVNMQHNCNQLPKSPVCDTDNVEYPNICWMLQRRKSLAYYGKCMPHCRARGLVCGHNGETYASECAAWAERVSVDYKGNCAAVGSNYGKSSRCGGIKCAPLPSEHCTKVYPPGSCCPICGAALRLLYSQKLSDWSVEAIRDVDTVVIQTIAEKLRAHVKVTECEVFAYLSLESDIIVLVIAITDSPTKLQVEACVREAGKLKALIQEQSPILLTELPLSFFTTATMIDAVSDSAVHLSFNLFTLIITIMGFFLQRTISN